ncbi:MAG: hypothetical protein LBK41_05800 [Clostridiales bacterium]|nr:hypothetical protein [Clostridiales bacterium]
MKGIPSGAGTRALTVRANFDVSSQVYAEGGKPVTGAGALGRLGWRLPN